MLDDKYFNRTAIILLSVLYFLGLEVGSKADELVQETSRIILKTSNDRKLALVSDESNEDLLSVASVSTLEPICQVSRGQIAPVKKATFSRNNKFLLIDFELPGTITPLKQTKSIHWEDQGFVYSKLFDLAACQEIKEFSELFSTYDNQFSPNSAYIYLSEDRIFQDGLMSKASSWRFNLKTKLVEEYTDPLPKKHCQSCNSPNRQANYQIIKDRQGKLAIKQENIVTQLFKSTVPDLIREVYALNEGRVLSLSQKNMTTFVDIKTGKGTSIPHRVYAFNHDQDIFVALNTRSTLSLYQYPTLEKKCDLRNVSFTQGDIDGQISSSPDLRAEFSPNGLFLAITTDGIARPDSYYPSYPTGIRNRWSHSRLFDLVTCSEVKSFSDGHAFSSGKFSSDSKFFNDATLKIVGDKTIPMNSWSFDLVEQKFIR